MGWFSWLLSPYVLVAAGGAIGSTLRYSVGRFAVWWLPSSPSLFATGGINLLGSFVLGCVIMAFGANQRGHPAILFLGVGLCGGFTTFSTLSMELAGLIESDRWWQALWYGVLSLVLGWIAFVAGAWIVQRTFGGELV